MKLVATVYEETCDAAIEAIRSIESPHDMVEVRAERFPWVNWDALRSATAKPMILTYRTAPSQLSGPPAASRQDERVQSTWTAALRAGIDFVDVEWREGVTIPDPGRTVLSHHDFEGMKDVEAIFANMLSRGCAHTKIAVTPRNFADNEALLRLLPAVTPRMPSVTVIGMGERGLYSRILAPFRGGELVFAAAGTIAAPGQLSLDRAFDIYGRAPQAAQRVFAVVGNPAGHSLSPVIHNRLFREKGVPAAYTIASVESFDEIRDAFLGGEPCGLSVTAPFKEDALSVEAEVGENARRAKAVNTLVNANGRILADNTDVDGFRALLPEASKAAVIGAGATARAALVALGDAGIPATVYNRTTTRGDAPLDALMRFDGDLIINTLPAGVDVPVPPCRTYIEAAYGSGTRRIEAEQHITGLDLLEAQAIRQHELFMRVFDGV